MITKSSNKGFVGIDMTVAIVAIIVFSGLIITLMYNNYLENIKIKKEALATIYLTQIFENIAIADYQDVTQANIDNFIPADLEENNYNVQLTITSNLELPDIENQDILKKVNAVISYQIANKQYQYTMERIKIKE